MNAPHNHWQCDFAGTREFEKAKSLVGPEVLVRGNVPREAACVAQSLGFCQKMLVTPQGFFDSLAVLDVGHDTIPFDDISVVISQWLTAVQWPSVLAIRSVKTNLAFMRFAACNGPAPFAFVRLKIIADGLPLVTLTRALVAPPYP